MRVTPSTSPASLQGEGLGHRDGAEQVLDAQQGVLAGAGRRHRQQGRRLLVAVAAKQTVGGCPGSIACFFSFSVSARGAGSCSAVSFPQPFSMGRSFAMGAVASVFAVSLSGPPRLPGRCSMTSVSSPAASMRTGRPPTEGSWRSSFSMCGVLGYR